MEIKTRFDSIVEKRIREALEEGKFDNLPGHGKPLDLEDDSHIPEDLRLSHKILKNAGCVPKELELNIEIRRMEDLIAELTDVTEKYRAMKKLNLLKRKMNGSRPGTSAFHIPESYEQQVVELLEKKTTPETDSK